MFRALYENVNHRRGYSKVTKKQIPGRKLNLEQAQSDNDDDFREVGDLISTQEHEQHGENTEIVFRSKQKRQNKTSNYEDIFSNKRQASIKSSRVLSASAPAAVSSQG